MTGEAYDDSGFLAVVGMAGRFPGAVDVPTFWNNLCAGVESVRILSEPTGDGRPVDAYGVLDDGDLFDARFFGYPPQEALVLDPQHRLFLECAYHALEDAGYDPARYPGAIGVYAGGSTTRYAEAVRSQRHAMPFVDDWQIRLATGPDFLATRAAHKLGLRGPAVSVQTACSTSLVAIHVAAQAVLSGECDMALAGGATLHVPPPRGGYTEGGILAPDGHLRAFDAGATGALGGSAVALVVLKPLADALADGDHVHAVLRGTAVNNDGGAKIGFTAPSVDGQARVIRAAHLVAQVEPATVGYIEAHGTGTPLGDPIEILALTRAFRAGQAKDTGWCGVGSVKTNVGHTDAAAGVTAFVKAALTVETGTIPPSLHFDQPNPEIDFASSPFRVVDKLTDWHSTGPRRAGVNALGIGGTNAHAVLEQPPVRGRTDPGRPWQLLPVSARDRTALDALGQALADRLATAGDTPLADIAWTLQVGRAAHPLRRFAVHGDTGDAASGFADAAERLGDGTATERPSVVFMFPGQGGQHLDMARELYTHEPEFRRHLDECCELAAPDLGLDLRDVLYPDDRAEAQRRLDTIAVSQPAVFVVEYALAQLWRFWGVRPAAVVGHSLGAYAAACVAGVLDLPDAVRLVVNRGRLLQGLPTGAMLAVELPEADLLPLLPAGLSVAAVNGPDRTTVSGPAGLVDEFHRQLTGRGVDARLLRIATAGHSALVEPVLAEFEAAVRQLRLAPPTVPFLSDMTGTWASTEQLTDPTYWSAHLRRPVRFGTALDTVLADSPRLLLEVGPGRVLTTLARQHPAAHRAIAVAHSLPHPADPVSDLATALTAAGRLWSCGVQLDWAALHAGERRQRVKLPLYPFQRQRYLVERATEPDHAAPASEGARIVCGDLPSPDLAPGPGEDIDSPPLTPTGARVSAGFTEILGVSRVPAYANFFDLGGDSLIAIRLAAWLRNEFEVTVSARDIFTAPTVARLAELVDGRRDATRTADPAGGNDVRG
ncbi:acyltransferase domain-containing protein [Micromonospora sp. C31]|uniref:type I polyketide synthase n=1 Tax=Micromonospora sp. C31 TaxID=2824876 RepID=UPI001B3772C4|nr:type I polyketide synthase [Micromonospora sp. C31]MBQ1075644.1 acyltransferase domain-containing protein [Micromonospora sp. C31]